MLRSATDNSFQEARLARANLSRLKASEEIPPPGKGAAALWIFVNRTFLSFLQQTPNLKPAQKNRTCQRIFDVPPSLLLPFRLLRKTWPEVIYRIYTASCDAWKNGSPNRENASANRLAQALERVINSDDLDDPST